MLTRIDSIDMEFAFTEEQEAFRDSVKRFVEEKSTTRDVRRLMETDQGYDQETFNACKEKFDTYRFDAASNPAYASIRRKYAGAKMYPFHVRDIPEAQEEAQ